MATNRRSFMKFASLAAAGSLAGLDPFGSLSAFAQTGATDYKALVCIFLMGGNDGNNVIIPTDAAGFANYRSLRGSLAVTQASVLSLNGQPTHGLSGAMPGVQSLYNGQHLALLANVGTLTTPITRTEFLANNDVAPRNLFSHADQQRIWQTEAPAGAVDTGWAGRASDLLSSSFGGTLPMVVSTSGSEIFTSGHSTFGMAVSPGSANVSGGVCNEGINCAIRLNAAQQLLTFSTGATLVQADQTITSNSFRYAAQLASAVKDASTLNTVFPTGNSLAAQLQQIAQIIQVRSTLGARRQIFFASLGSFDTHTNQLATQTSLLGQLDAALTAFNAATIELGVNSNVTSFTMSDFGRALTPNTAYGSDHAWGSHHLVMGGAVKGGKLYGTLPTLALGGPDDAGADGRWIPTTSTTQYAATLASWFGVPSTQLDTVFPLLPNFKSNNLGFV